MTGDELAALLADGDLQLLDVRSAGEYDGSSGYPCDPVQGHIPGAVNIDVEELAGAGAGRAGAARRSTASIRGRASSATATPAGARPTRRRRARRRRHRGRELRGLVARVVARPPGYDPATGRS